MAGVSSRRCASPASLIDRPIPSLFVRPSLAGITVCFSNSPRAHHSAAETHHGQRARRWCGGWCWGRGRRGGGSWRSWGVGVKGGGRGVGDLRTIRLQCCWVVGGVRIRDYYFFMLLLWNYVVVLFYVLLVVDHILHFSSPLYISFPT